MTNNAENLRFCFSMKHLETLNDLVISKGNKMLGKEKGSLWFASVGLTKIFLQKSCDLGKRQDTFLLAGCSQPQGLWNYFLFQAPLQQGDCLEPLSELWCMGSGDSTLPQQAAGQDLSPPWQTLHFQGLLPASVSFLPSVKWWGGHFHGKKMAPDRPELAHPCSAVSPWAELLWFHC